MEIIEGIKDTARKATNSVVDTAEELVGKPKTPKELAKRFIEHLNHREYQKIADIVSEEAKKYASKMGVDDIELVNDKLDAFKNSVHDAAKDFESGEYRQIASKLKEVKKSIPDQEGATSKIFSPIKGFLESVIQILDEYSKAKERGEAVGEPDFSKLQTVFEEHLAQLLSK